MSLLSRLAKWLFFSLLGSAGSWWVPTVPGPLSLTDLTTLPENTKNYFRKTVHHPCVSQRWACVFRLLAMSTGMVVVGPLGTPLPFCGGSTRRDRQGVCCRLERVAGAGWFPANTYRNRPAHRPPPQHPGESSRYSHSFPKTPRIPAVEGGVYFA